jgi:hypothetical protein
MKGFMHIIEILLIAILVFFAFMQFAMIPEISGDWAQAKLQILSGDIVSAFEARGVDWFNATELEQEFNATLPENVLYSVRLQNVIKPRIKVACLCNDSSFQTVQGMLSPGWFVINGVNTSFELVQLSDPANAFSIDNDAVIVYGSRDLSGSYSAVRNFLGYGKGIVEVSDRPGSDAVQRDFFGLSSGARTSDGSEIMFSASSAQGGSETGQVFEYFSHIPLFSDSFNNLDQWAGDGSVSATGNPAPSVRLSGNGCASMDRFMYTRYFSSFEGGEIDFDVYLPAGSSLLVAFGRGGGYDYLASLSANQTSGYDSFYRRSPLQAIGTNTSHLTAPSKWSHVKIAANSTEIALYNDGKKVAAAAPSGLTQSNITLFSRCGDAYVDNVRVTYDRREFASFLSNENTTQVDNDQGRILLVQKGTSLPACIIDYNIEGAGNGRTAWLSAGQANEDYKTLVKALVSWAAGDEYWTIKANIRNPVSSYIHKPLGGEMMQNAKVIVELGYLY